MTTCVVRQYEGLTSSYQLRHNSKYLIIIQLSSLIHIWSRSSGYFGCLDQFSERAEVAPARMRRPTRRRRSTGHTKAGKNGQASAALAGSSGSLKSRTVSSITSRSPIQPKREVILALEILAALAALALSSSCPCRCGASHAASNGGLVASPRDGRMGRARRQTLASSSCQKKMPMYVSF